MATIEKYLIIGAGQTSGRAAEALRKQGYEGNITIVGDEPYPPYERPPLSKQILVGEDEPDTTYVHDSDYYKENRIDLRVGVRANSIDRTSKLVSLNDGTMLSYTKLLIATGSKLRQLQIPGSDLAGIYYLRGIDDTLEIRKELSSGCNVVVVGGGYIGLEVAAAARKWNCNVTVIEMFPQVLNRATAPEVGAIFETIHRDRGVKIITNTSVIGFEGDKRIQRVLCENKEAVDAEIVVVGIGILPNDDLASIAGLPTDNGIIVDQFGQTEDPCIYAAGDVTNHPNAILGHRVRLESWQNAQNQAITVAKAMCGIKEPYTQVPWFWSDQYEVNLQIIGMPERWSTLVFRGDTTALSFTAFYLDDGYVVGANAINNARDIAIARQMIQRKMKIDPKKLSDTEISLRKLMKSIDA